jgi:hypothetical protein
MLYALCAMLNALCALLPLFLLCSLCGKKKKSIDLTDMIPLYHLIIEPLYDNWVRLDVLKIKTPINFPKIDKYS